MRQKADKLEKGRWYADFSDAFTFLKFSHLDGGIQFFYKQREVDGISYLLDSHGFIPLFQQDRFLPSQEDIEKYNLNETE